MTPDVGPKLVVTTRESPNWERASSTRLRALNGLKASFNDSTVDSMVNIRIPY
jgi:hypothetical protein